MNKRRICPVCYGKAHVNKLAKINPKTGWYEFYYLVRCEDCLTEVKSDLKQAIEIFPAYEAEDVKVDPAMPEDNTSYNNTYVFSVVELNSPYKEYLCGLNDRTNLADIKWY